MSSNKDVSRYIYIYIYIFFFFFSLSSKILLYKENITKIIIIIYIYYINLFINL